MASNAPTLFKNEPLFWDAARKGVMGPTLTNPEVEGTNIILTAMVELPVSWVAYALATAWHETAHTMQPVKEYGGNAYFFRMYDIKGQRPSVARTLGNLYDGDGVLFCGRGYPQTTGRTNYGKADKKLKAMGVLAPSENLLTNPDLMLQARVAAPTMRWGMVEGWFTGKKFSTYLPNDNSPATKEAFTRARYIINGQDKAALIADYALDFQADLIEGGWIL